MGHGYYWLKKGNTYIIDSQEITFENDYIIDYSNKKYITLSNRAVNWNDNSTLAVNEGIVLNLDPMNFSEGEWVKNNDEFDDFIVTNPQTGLTTNTGVQKTGDVIYDSENRALKFNEDEKNNPKGEGGYLKLLKNSDFKDGVTFEMYCNLSRLRYVSAREDWPSLGIFIKIPYLGANFGNSFSFGYNGDGVILRFGEKYAKAFESESGQLSVRTNGRVYCNDIFELNKDLYYTVVYMRYYDESADDYMKSNNVDKILIYIDGKLYDEVYYSSEAYDNGLEQWNLESSPVFIGVTPWGEYDSNYFLKGMVYTNRLYNGALNSKQVEDNYNMTLKYRSSF